jgi:RNA polymerase sigma-70 factor (ECF subfamily)
MNEPHAPADPASASPSAAPLPAEKQRLAMALETNFALVWRSLRRFGVPEADVDDAAQQAFITLAGRLAEITPGAERSFLLGTCQRLAANQRRKLARRPEVADEEPDRRVGRGLDPEQAMLEKQRRHKLDQGLAALPLEQRTVFVLFELEGFGLREIAESLGIPLGTVTSRLRRAREKFEVWAAAQGEKP